MNDAASYAVQNLASSHRTTYPVDLAAQVMLIRGAPDRAHAVRCVLEARAQWRAYLTVQQRNWQTRISRRHRANVRHARTCTYRMSILEGEALEVAVQREALERANVRERYVRGNR